MVFDIVVTMVVVVTVVLLGWRSIGKTLPRV